MKTLRSFLLLVYMVSFSGLVGHSQSVQAVPTNSPSRSEKPLAALYGQWVAGECYVIDRGCRRKAIPTSPNEQGYFSLLPEGMLIEFKQDDSRAELSYLNWVNPMPKGSDWFASTKLFMEENTHTFAGNPLYAASWQFVLEINHKNVYRSYGAVGATAKEVTYKTHTLGYPSDGNYFIEKNGNVMWQEILVDVIAFNPQTQKWYRPGQEFPTYQVYRRKTTQSRQPTLVDTTPPRK